MFVALTTYFGYAILTIFGRLRDLFGRAVRAEELVVVKREGAKDAGREARSEGGRGGGLRLGDERGEGHAESARRPVDEIVGKKRRRGEIGVPRDLTRCGTHRRARTRSVMKILYPL